MITERVTGQTIQSPWRSAFASGAPGNWFKNQKARWIINFPPEKEIVQYVFSG